MQFSCSTVLLSAIALAGTCMCCICGYMALDGTMDLFENYGPKQGFGNPATDDPPNYVLNAITGEQELVNSAVMGNILPQVFKNIQYYLITIGVIMVINVMTFFVIISLIQRALADLYYEHQFTPWSNLRYTKLLSGYAGFFVLVWLGTCCFCVLPLVQYVITIQRCDDLDNPNFTSPQDICVDLVQYGLVPYRELPNSGYGLICGPGPFERGNLEELCKNYSGNFNLYVICLAGACLTLITLVLYVIRGLSLHFSLEPFFAAPPDPPVMTNAYKSNNYKQTSFAPNPYNSYANSVHNPNYENNLLSDPLLRAPSNADSYPVLAVPPGGDGMEMKKRYYSDAGDHNATRQSEKSILRSSSSSVIPNDVHTYPSQRAPSHQSSKLARHTSTDSMDTTRPKSSVSDVHRKKPNRSSVRQVSSELDSDMDNHESSDVASEVNRSATAYRPRPLKKKPRSTRSDPDIYRKSSRRNAPKKKVPTIDEYDSPPSDYYLQEDVKRRSMRTNSRTRSVY